MPSEFVGQLIVGAGLIGTAMTIVGAWATARGVMLTPDKASALSEPRWGGNSSLRGALLFQSTAARQGLYLIALGGLVQLVGQMLQAYQLAVQ